MHQYTEKTPPRVSLGGVAGTLHRPGLGTSPPLSAPITISARPDRGPVTFAHPKGYEAQSFDTAQHAAATYHDIAALNLAQGYRSFSFSLFTFISLSFCLSFFFIL